MSEIQTRVTLSATEPTNANWNGIIDGTSPVPLSEASVKNLSLGAVCVEEGMQSRVAIDHGTVEEYAESTREGATFPPVVAFYDGENYWLADGFHRFYAHRQAHKTSIAVDVRHGTKRDAILFSLTANNAHGLRRTNADKRKAVQTLLEDPEWSEWSDREIAKACGVGHPFVAALRHPEVAQKQKENRNASATKKAGKVESDSTPDEPEMGERVESDSTPAAKSAALKPKRSLDNPTVDAPELTEADKLTEAFDTINQLAEENEQLRDKLAVEQMDTSDSAKTEAAFIITELRAQVKALEAELDAVKASRDTYMREATEAKKQAIYWRKKAEKAEKVAP